jgi:hypothetical protein
MEIKKAGAPPYGGVRHFRVVKKVKPAGKPGQPSCPLDRVVSRKGDSGEYIQRERERERERERQRD